MKLSTRGRYGLRLLIDLAEHPDDSHLALAAVAQRQRISVRYLEQVAVILRRSGFIRSIKGASGGYALARSPETIGVGDVLRALEGDIYLVDPVRPEERQTAVQRCVRSLVYDRLNDRVAALLDSKTLAHLIGQDSSPDGCMFFI